MNFSQFKESIHSKEIPEGLPLYLQSLWWDGKGDWDTAHSLIDSLNDEDAAFVHAYLHRKEGDQGNASYWYRRAGRNKPDITLDKEWEDMVRYFLERE